MDLGVVRRFVEHMLRDEGFTGITCKAQGTRVEITTATKGLVTVKQTAAGISKEGVAFMSPTFAAKLDGSLDDFDAELRCLLR